MDAVYTWIKNIVIYMILNTIIMNLLGNSSYKKYVSIISGMILVLIVISPLMSLMKIDEKFDYFFQYNDFSVETSDFKNNLAHMEEKQSDAVFQDYEGRIRKQVENMLKEENIYLKEFHAEFNRDRSSPQLGEITKMNLVVSSKNEATAAENRISFEEIKIEKIDIDGKKEDASQHVPSPMEINIKNELSDFYNIDPANINISIQGG